MTSPKFTIEGCRGKNPLWLTKQATDKHPNHKTPDGTSKACFECQNKRCKESNVILACPNCKLYCLHLCNLSNKPEGYEFMENEAEIYCSACCLHWGRTNNW